LYIALKEKFYTVAMLPKIFGGRDCTFTMPPNRLHILLAKRSVYSHDRRVLSTPVGYSHDDQSEAR